VPRGEYGREKSNDELAKKGGDANPGNGTKSMRKERRDGEGEGGARKPGKIRKRSRIPAG
jgi:hypothetical protein